MLPPPPNIVVLTASRYLPHDPVCNPFITQHSIDASSDDVSGIIVKAAKQLDDCRSPLTQIGVQFIQIGGNRNTSNALRSLENELKNIHKIRVSLPRVVTYQKFNVISCRISLI